MNKKYGISFSLTYGIYRPTVCSNCLKASVAGGYWPTSVV